MEDSKNMNAEKMAQDAPEAAAGMDTATAAEAPQDKSADAHSITSLMK